MSAIPFILGGILVFIWMRVKLYSLTRNEHKYRFDALRVELFFLLIEEKISLSLYNRILSILNIVIPSSREEFHRLKLTKKYLIQVFREAEPCFNQPLWEELKLAEQEAKVFFSKFSQIRILVLR